MKPLSTIEMFGAIDADNDDILFECFEDHEAFIDLLNFRKFLIIGRKGSGKTAIFRKLLKTHAEDFFCYGHTFADYPWHHHDRQQRIGIPDYDKYTHSWKYLLLLTLSKVILNHDQSIPFDDASLDALSKIETFVVDTYGTRDPDVTQLFTPTRHLKLRPAFEMNWNILKIGVSPERVPMEDLPSIVQEVNENLLTYVLACLNPDNRYYVCFDQLDLGFDPTNHEYSNRLIGLLLASRDINVAARKANRKLCAAVFLRDDIYADLHFEDKNKLTENFVSIIEWDTPRTQKTLKGLMEKRFTRLLQDGGGGSVKWEDVFDETKQMPSRQAKYQHILDRTYLRPRDMIKFCNEVLSQYKTRGETGDSPAIGNSSRLDNIDVHSAKQEYSHYFLNELDDEIHKHVPDYANYLEIVKTIGSLQFSREQFIATCGSRQTLLGNVQDPMEILSALFQFSVIGYYRAGGRGYGGSQYVYKYKDPRAKFDPTAELFRLHPGLMEVLALKKYTQAD